MMSELTQPEIVERAKRLLIDKRREDYLEFMETAVDRFPDDPEIRLLYATALLPYAPDRVAVQVATAIQLESNNPWRLTRAASILFHLGELDAARAYVGRAAQFAPADFEFGPELAHLGGLLAALDGNDEIAEEALEAALEAEPGRPNFTRDLAKFLSERGRTQEALEVIDQGLVHNPENQELAELRTDFDGQDDAD
jgi:Flp pilus assembly protein TadD